MGRSPCCAKEGLNRGAWTAMEDKILTDYIKLHGEGKWRSLPIKAGLKRCGKSCRLRWLNYLKPDIKRGNISRDEEDLIIRLHNLLGNRWSLIAGRLPGRTDNEIKNYWNTNIGKRINLTNINTDPDHDNNNNNQDHHPSKLRNDHHNKKKKMMKKKKKIEDDVLLHQKTKMKENSSMRVQIPPHVVRTKATRCNKVFISIKTMDPPPQQRTTSNHHQYSSSSILEATAKDQDTNIIIDTARDHCSNTFITDTVHHPLQNPHSDNDLSMMDIDISDEFLTTVMNTTTTTTTTPAANNDYTLFTDKDDENNDIAMRLQQLSYDDDDGLFFNKENNDDGDDIIMMMQAAADAGQLEFDDTNNWFASFLGVDITDFDQTPPPQPPPLLVQQIDQTT